jgi:hypothetical protein
MAILNLVRSSLSAMCSFSIESTFSPYTDRMCELVGMWTYKLGDLLALLVDMQFQLVDVSNRSHTLVLNFYVLLLPIEVL